MMDSESELKDLLDAVKISLVNFTRTTNEISAKDVGFLRSSNPKVGKKLEKSNARLLGLTRKLLHSAVSGTSLKPPQVASADDLEDNWRGVVNVIDKLLEKTDLALDEYTGAINRNVAEPDAQKPSGPDFKRGWAKRSAIPKPQAHFRNTPNNTTGAIFKPLLREKPHAKVALEESIAPGSGSSTEEQYRHPYKTEIETYKYPKFVHKKQEPIPFSPPGDSEAIFVDTPEGVQAMLEELKQAKEIAIDLEHHDRHSYIGIVSLMQISTREKDWVVDTLKPWREDLQVLNEVFTDPSILKVFHGASMDIIWLQRDLGLYVVGLFDTFHASSELHYERRSLAFLLKKFADFEAQKQYQLADWRVRPLPQELYEYARSDTHFLLNIYDHVRNELIDESNFAPGQPNLIDVVQEKSKQECLKKYEHYVYDAEGGTGPSGWYNMLSSTPALFSPSQFAVFKEVHQWRDTVAREEDENLLAIMSNQSLFNVARAMPDELPKLYATIQPISEFVKERIDELLHLVITAKNEGANGPEMLKVLAEHPLTTEREARKAERKRALGELHLHAATRADADASAVQQSIVDLDADASAFVKKASQFWGSAWHDVSRVASEQQSESANGPLAPGFTLPMPPVLAETTIADPAPDVEMEEAPQPTPVEKAEPAEPDTFVLREGTRNRKRKTPATSGADDGQEEALDETGQELTDALRQVQEADEDEAQEAKRARKAAKKAAKEERRAAREAAKQALAEEAPFDYASAPSVLNAAWNGTEPKKEGARPYAKAMDAPRGLPRVKRELQGKSMTFKK